MANFPGSVYNPSAVANGQTIDASRDNGQDAEITAIEQGYLQGSAPLNSSNSTHANLSVSGGTTLAGALSVAGGSTFAVRPVLPPPEFALVYLGSTVTIGSSAASTVAWTQDSYLSTTTLHSTASNAERLVPPTTGIYQFSAQVGMTAAGAGVRQVAIQDSSNNAIATLRVVDSTGVAHTLNLTGYKRFDAIGGYGVVTLSLSGNSTISLSSGITQSWFSMLKL